MLALLSPACAQSAGPSPAPAHMPPGTEMTDPMMESRAARRFPQPVRVGALIDRDLLEPLWTQPVLGRVTGVVRPDGDGAGLIVRLDGSLAVHWLGWRGFGRRSVRVPTAAVGLLGEYVALMDLTPEQLRALPTFETGSAPELPPDETLRIGIVRPFH